ncbi:MAG: YARHG domain-containing protein [Muribaculaceae bacterium]|nr:YARHG domain-containing protein [Muribaculaceae bacterium]
MKLGKLIICVIVLSFAMSAVAQNRIYLNERYMNQEYVDSIMSTIRNDLANCKAKRQVLPVKKYLLGDVGTYWTDGFEVICALYDGERYIEAELIALPGSEVGGRGFEPMFNVRGNNVTVKGKPNIKVSVERIGSRVMLVERNAAGVPIKCYYSMTNQEMNMGLLFKYHQFLLLGNYSIPNDHNLIFGPKMDFYDANKYDYDPGWFTSFINSDYKSVDIVYGDGRVSHGDPSSPGYNNMPGGGGAGALMGPMEWRVVPCKEGLKVTVLRDEKFVDHSPSIPTDSETVATKLQCPYEGIDGKWAFASVVPLTPDILKIFPKEVLTLMRGEIYARHGDTFSNPETQRYFNAQPWYKKSNKPVALTDLERFNYSVIKYAESLK